MPAISRKLDCPPRQDSRYMPRKELPRIPLWIPGGSVRLWTEELHNVSMFLSVRVGSRACFAALSRSWRAHGRAVPSRRARTQRRIGVYAPTPLFLHSLDFTKVRREREKERQRERSTARVVPRSSNSLMHIVTRC